MTAAVLMALLPIVLLVCLGRALCRSRFLDDGFWPQAEKLCYYVLLPCLFIQSLASVRLDALPVGRLALTLILSILCVAALVIVVLRPLIGADGPAFTSVFQGSVRFNNYVGVTLVAGLFGEQGIALAAICNAAIVPTVNVLCVLVFARYGTMKPGDRGVLKQVAMNPLVAASFVGIAFQALGLALPPGIASALKALGTASLPLGLLCIGAALDFHAARQWIVPVVSSSVMKFVVMPVVTLLIALSAGLTDASLMTALVFQMLPTATSSYIMARQLGGDAPLMAGITAAQTVLALAAIPSVLLGISMWVTL
jgi:predicted permease